jgi:hypothetical protein
MVSRQGHGIFSLKHEMFRPLSPFTNEENESACGLTADITNGGKTMTTKLFAVLLLTLALAGCDAGSTNENSSPANRNTNANPAASPNTTEQATPAPVSNTSSMPSTSQLKAGDKVKVTIAGKAIDATVVSVDEKVGKAVVKTSGGEEKTVALGDVTKE